MVSRNVVLWEVDTQADFMLPGGKLYVPGAERLLPNIRKLADAARQGHVFLVSHGCYHGKDDPEFKTFPPHCIKGTTGAGLVPEALTQRVITVANEPTAALPAPRSPRGIRCLWSSHGILCSFRGQGFARAEPARFRRPGCN
jgi:nicotinamidase-related amidase